MSANTQSPWRIIGAYPSSSYPIEKPFGALRLVCQSDTHSQFERRYVAGQAKVPEGDIFIHAGDFSSTGTFNEVRQFRDYVLSLPHPNKVIIAGNHDITFDTNYYINRGRDRFHRQNPSDPIATKSLIAECSGITYLQDSGINILGMNIYGSPWQPEFYDWAFNGARGEEMRNHWAKIPAGTDVLVTHGPPYRYGDWVLRGENVGCLDLLNKVREIKPMLHVFGHIHEAFGISSEGETTFVNACSCTLRYQPTNPLVVVDVIRSRE